MGGRQGDPCPPIVFPRMTHVDPDLAFSVDGGTGNKWALPQHRHGWPPNHVLISWASCRENG